MVLIDTSAWIFALKKNFHPSIKERIGQILTESDVAINGIIELELLGGAKTEKEYERLKAGLMLFIISRLQNPSGMLHQKLAFDLKRKGVNTPYTDILIAASAIQEKAILLHADSHFDTIAKHSGLKVESLAAYIK